MSKRRLLLLLLLVGCRGQILATAKWTGRGPAETRFTADKGVELWSDFDGQWEGNASSKYSTPPLAYLIEVVQDGAPLGKVECKTHGSSRRSCGSFTKSGSNFGGNCEFRMNCELPPFHAGEVVLRVTGRLADPARVKEVKNMSLNVRAP